MQDLMDYSGGSNWPRVALHVAVGYLLLKPTLGHKMMEARLEEVAESFCPLGFVVVENPSS